MISCPMPFSPNTQQQLVLQKNVPTGAEFMLDVRTTGVVQRSTLIFKKLNVSWSPPSEFKQGKGKRNSSKRRANRFVVAEWSSGGYPELLQWSFIETVPTWYTQTRKQDPEQQPVLCIKVEFIPKRTRKRTKYSEQTQHVLDVLDCLDGASERKDNEEDQRENKKEQIELPGSAPVQKIHLKIRWVTSGNSKSFHSLINIDTTTDTTVEAIKNQLSQRIEINVECMTLYYDQWQLEDDRKLDWYAVTSPAHLEMITFVPREYVFFKNGAGCWLEQEEQKEQEEQEEKIEKSVVWVDGKEKKGEKNDSLVLDKNKNKNTEVENLNHFYYITSHINFFHGNKYFSNPASAADSATSPEQNDSTSNLPWYIRHTPLHVDRQLRPIIRYRARFRESFWSFFFFFCCCFPL